MRLRTSCGVRAARELIPFASRPSTAIIAGTLANRLSHMDRSAMSDTLPDRLSNNPDSPYYDAALLERGVGIRFKGVDKTNVEEYCVSEGWIRVAAGKARDRHGNPLTIKLSGTVEPYLREKKAE
jgi:hypothetical protein